MTVSPTRADRSTTGATRGQDGRWEDSPGENGCYARGILSALVADPDRIAVHWRGRAITAGELARSVVGLVRELREAGIGPASTVAVLVAPNSPDMLSVRYATHLLGGAVTYVRGSNPGSTVPVLSAGAQARILSDTAAAVLCADAEHAGRARELAELLPGRFRVVRTDTVTAAADAGRAVAELDDLPVGDPDGLALVSFSSGTTGRPKGVRVSTRVWQRIVDETIPLVAEADPRLLVVTPLSFVVGQMADAVLRVGGTVVLHEEFDAARAVRALAEHRITRTFMATPHLYRALEAVKAGRPDLSRLRMLVYTGVTAAPARLEEAVRVFGPVLLQAYGSTEAGRISVLLPEEHYVPRLRSTVGRVFPDVALEVRDPDTGEVLPAGSTGEIWVRSPNVMDGYLDGPGATARVLRNGWCRTGDIGGIDAQGYLSLSDRVADVVKTGGVKVYPAAVEREVATLAGVVDCAVYGVRDTDDLEHVHAAVVTGPGARLDPEAVRSHVRAALSPFHTPESVRFLDEIPLGPSGKPDKQWLRRTHPAG